MDRWLGSIEVGKVADFTVLGANPLDYAADRGGDPTQILAIPGGGDVYQRRGDAVS